MHRRPGSTVHIWVSKGKARFVVPPLAGKDLDTATQELLDAGLLLGVIKKVYDPALPPGQVVSQQPQAGQEFLDAPAVDLLVADKEQTDIGPMPNLVGQPLADAERLLGSLQLSKVTYVVSASAAPGTVLKQSLAADTPAKLGQKVELEVAMAVADAQQHEKQLQVQITIPEGAPQQQVRITVVDELGESNVSDETKAPHDSVQRRVEVTGAAKILIFLRDMKTPWRTDVIPYEAPAPWTPPADDTAPPLGGGTNTPPPGATL
jgi:beta-lactam-binding protein with PASTA domain